MQRVFAGQPIRANTINTMMHALESINILPPGSFSPAASRQYLYPTLPAFAVTMVNGKAYVSNGAVYVDGRPISGDTFGSLGGSITGYEASRFGESGAVYVAVEYNTKPRTTSVESNPAAPTSGIENPAEGIARLVWEPPTRPADSPYERFYSLKIAEIVEDNGNRYARIFHRGNIFITGDGEDTTGEAVPLAQYLASVPDIPGKIAGIQRIPADTWMQTGTTSITGAWTANGSAIEKIENGIIYLKEPREYLLANFQPGATAMSNNYGLIAAVYMDEAPGTARITNGALHLPSRIEPPAEFLPATFDGGARNTTCVMGSVQTITATSSVDGIPRMIGGNIYLPAANSDSPTHGTTPGYVHGIRYTSGIERPRIHEGLIELPEPTENGDCPLGLYLSSGVMLDLSECDEATLYKLHGNAQQRSAAYVVFASGTYAQVCKGAHASYLRFFTLTGNEMFESESSLDTIAQNLTGTSSIHT